MKYIKNVQNLRSKKVLVRIDINEPVDSQGRPLDIFRIQKAANTISWLVEQHAKIILMAHLGDPKGHIVNNLKLDFIGHELSLLLDKKIKKLYHIVDDSVTLEVNAMQEGEIILLENLRFDEGEEVNSELFALKLSQLADIYVNDAFSVCHRNHASISAITKHLPSYAGLQLELELQHLEKVLKEPVSPSVAIIGGAKIETKMPVINVLKETYDYVLVGGKIANEYLDQYGDNTEDNIILPIDFTGLEKQDKFDIGPKTIKLFSHIISTASIIVWNGPMGWFEHKPYDNGTIKIAQAIAKNEKSFSLIGGGETVDEIYNLHKEKKIDFISTGGGAMLDYISGKELPGLKALSLGS